MSKTWRMLLLSVLPGFLCLGAAAADFIRGDSNSDGALNISDAPHTLRWLFLAGREPDCPAAADPNDDETIDISDPIYVMNWLCR